MPRAYLHITLPYQRFLRSRGVQLKTDSIESPREKGQHEERRKVDPSYPYLILCSDENSWYWLAAEVASLASSCNADTGGQAFWIMRPARRSSQPTQIDLR